MAGGANPKIITAGRFPVPAQAAGSFLLVGEVIVPGGMGPNGRLNVSLALENLSGQPATVQVYYGGHLVWDNVFVDSRTYSIVVSNQNNTQSQRCIRDFLLRQVAVDSTKQLPLQVYIAKSNANDIVAVAQLQVQVSAGNSIDVETQYHSTQGVQVLRAADIAQNPLPAKVLNDPERTFRNLSDTPYTFPANFFNVSIKTWPINSPVFPPFDFTMHRTLEVNDLDWLHVQTAQATAAYANPTGPAPAGISSTQLALMDAMFAACAIAGKEMVVNLCSAFSTAAPWYEALGGTSFPLSLPPAGANRTAALNSLKFYVRFLCERYRARHPQMQWWIEPLNEPNNPGVWVGQAGALVALSLAIKEQVDISGGTQVRCIAPSWTDKSGVSFVNPGSSEIGSTRPTLHEYLGNGGWGHFDVLTYHVYNGSVAFRNTNTSDALRQQGLFSHDLSILDPLNDTTNGGRYVGLLGLIKELGLGSTIVPGVSSYGNKPIWITETGDAYGGSRDMNWYIRLALICSALGVTRYVFYYYGNNQFGALPDMEIDTQEYQKALKFLEGKTIQWVNANSTLTRVAASINGEVLRF